MRLFLDTANIEEIKQYFPLISGITTNPLIMAREGVKQEERLKEICTLTQMPVSAEVVRAESTEQIIKDAIKLSQIASNIVVKIPGNLMGFKAIKALSMPTNVTALVTFEQMSLAASLGATFVSIFYCRALDSKLNPWAAIYKAKRFIEKNNLKTMIIVGSLRSEEDVKIAYGSEADIVTVPPKLFSVFTHPTTDATIAEFTQKYES